MQLISATLSPKHLRRVPFCQTNKLKPQKKKRRVRRGAFLGERLAHAADLDRVRPLRAVRDFKAHLVAFAKLIEAYADELVGVEKEIFFATLNLDEPESLVGETGNSSFLHSNRDWLVNIKCRVGVVGRSLAIWINPELIRTAY